MAPPLPPLAPPPVALPPPAAPWAAPTAADRAGVGRVAGDGVEPGAAAAARGAGLGRHRAAGLGAAATRGAGLESDGAGAAPAAPVPAWGAVAPPPPPPPAAWSTPDAAPLRPAPPFSPVDSDDDFVVPEGLVDVERRSNCSLDAIVAVLSQCPTFRRALGNGAEAEAAQSDALRYLGAAFRASAEGIGRRGRRGGRRPPRGAGRAGQRRGRRGRPERAGDGRRAPRRRRGIGRGRRRPDLGEEVPRRGFGATHPGSHPPASLQEVRHRNADFRDDVAFDELARSAPAAALVHAALSGTGRVRERVWLRRECSATLRVAAKRATGVRAGGVRSRRGPRPTCQGARAEPRVVLDGSGGRRRRWRCSNSPGATRRWLQERSLLRRMRRAAPSTDSRANWTSLRWPCTRTRTTRRSGALGRSDSWTHHDRRSAVAVGAFANAMLRCRDGPMLPLYLLFFATRWRAYLRAAVSSASRDRTG